MPRLHLPAIAHEAGIRFTLDDVAEVFARTPLHRRPAARRAAICAVDLFGVGGTDAVLKALLDGGYLHGDALTLSGRTLAEHLAPARRTRRRGRAVRRRKPMHADGRLVVLHGNLAPDGALIKIAGLKTLVFEGRARVFDGEEACFAGRHERANTARATCWSSATKGRRAGRACARCWASPRSSTARAWAKRWRSSPMAVSPARRAGMMIGYVGPEAAVGGPDRAGARRR